MKVNLPKNHKNIHTKTASDLYTEATEHTCYSRAKLGSNSVMYTSPKYFNPAKSGMLTSNYSNEAEALLNFDKDASVRKNIFLALRNIAKTHPVHRACIEIYSHYPIVGLDLKHSDHAIEQFYKELFLEDLDYENFFSLLGKQYWVDGTAFVYSEWNKDLNLWVNNQILDPINMDIERVPLSGEEVVRLIPDEQLRGMARDTSETARKFQRQFPGVAEQLRKNNYITFSNDVMTVIANRDRDSDLWGTPVMLRSWNTLRLEDRMNAAMAATADRLYAPLLLFTIGGKLPNGETYIPPAAALDKFRESLDAALSSDFRAIIAHEGVQAQEIIRSDRLNSFKSDSDFYDEKHYTAWGLSSAILNPSSQNYATSALQFQLAGQMMDRYKKALVSVYNKQAEKIAQTHGHYELDGNGRVVYEDREVWNEQRQEFVVESVPKISYPKMTFDVIDFKDEKQQRDFLMNLRREGIPIANEDIAIGVDIDLSDSKDKYIEERVSDNIIEADIHYRTYKACMEKGIPVPPETSSYLKNSLLGGDLKEIQEAIDDKKDDILNYDGRQDNNKQTDYDEDDDEEKERTRPEVSDEQRKDMPRA